MTHYVPTTTGELTDAVYRHRVAFIMPVKDRGWGLVSDCACGETFTAVNSAEIKFLHAAHVASVLSELLEREAQ